MISPPIALWTIALDGARLVAVCQDDVISEASPAALWRAIASRSARGLVHLAGAGQTVEVAALGRAGVRMAERGLDATIGRVRDGSGQLSMHLSQPASLRFLALFPGTILVRNEALARAAEAGLDREADAFWPHDLANALMLRGLIAGVDDVFADCAGPLASIERMPFARANPRMSQPDQPLILIYGAIEASVSLYFDGLPADLYAQLRFLKPGDLASDMEWLTDAALVVVMRDFEHMLLTGTLDLLTETGTPFVWFTDDDFMALGAEDRGLGFYSAERVAAFAARAAAIVVTSIALADRMRCLNDRVVMWPCVYDAALGAGAPSRSVDELRVGAFGGVFRRAAFERDILPAAAALRAERPLALLANAELAGGAAGVGQIGFEPDFRAFVLRWQRLDLNVLVHPYGVTLNIGSKSEASLLAASYIGAVPIVGDEPAYAGLDETNGVLKAEPSRESWLLQLRRLGDRERREGVYRLLDSWCRSRFDPEKARASFAALIDMALDDGAEGSTARREHARRSPVVQQALFPPPPAGPSFYKRLRRSFSRPWRRFVLRRG